MCIILSVYQKTKDPRVQNTILNIYEEKKGTHKDGVGIVAYNKTEKGKIYSLRELSINSSKIEELLRAYDIVHIHLRQATTGRVTRDNCHFWNLKGWYFAHNGAVYGEQTRSLQEEFTDSYLLFSNLVRNKYIQKGKLKYDKIREHISSINFWGRFTLLDSNTKNMYYFGDFHAYTLGDDNLIVSTTPLTFNPIHTLFGLYFEDSKVQVRDLDFEGIYYIDAVNETARLIHNGDLEKGYKKWFKHEKI